jgi:hypothetical protein
VLACGGDHAFAEWILLEGQQEILIVEDTDPQTQKNPHSSSSTQLHVFAHLARPRSDSTSTGQAFTKECSHEFHDHSHASRQRKGKSTISLCSSHDIGHASCHTKNAETSPSPCHAKSFQRDPMEICILIHYAANMK